MKQELFDYALTHPDYRIDALKAEDKILEMLSIKQVYPLQEISTRLGYALGHTGLDAHMVGADLLYSMAIPEYKILEHKGTPIVKGRHSLLMSKEDRESYDTEHSRRLLPFLERPIDWVNNKTHGSCITGAGNNHHIGYQALDVLNTLQKISWKHSPIITDPEPTRSKNGRKRPKTEMDQCNKFNAEYLGTKFFFLWKFDKRGRSYSTGYDMNLQAYEYRKASIQFAVEKPLTERGRYWLRVDMANTFGARKSFDKQAAMGEKILSNPDWYLARAKEPYMLKKAILAYSGKSTGHNMFLDASTSGLQIMSVLASCRATAERVNVIGTERNDAYKLIGDAMGKTRDDVKYPVMTHYYNSVKVPREVLGADYSAFLKLLAKTFTGAEDVLSILNSCWNPDSSYYTWTMPDDHVCKVKVIVEKNTTIKLTGKKREFEYKYKYYDNEASDYAVELAPNVIHSIDGYIAREMVRRVTNRKGDNNEIIAHIHDAFTFHPNDADKVTQAYREILADINDSDLLADIVYQLSGNKIGITKEIKREEILGSVYAIN